MNREIPPHEKIRFRRGERVRLDRLPSALPLPRSRGWRAAPRRAVKLFVAATAGTVAVMVLAVAAIITGVGEERLRVEAQSVMSELVGEGFDARLGGTELSFDGVHMLAVAARDARIVSAATEAEVMRVGHASFGVRFLPLVRGEVKLGSLRVSDARIAVAAMPSMADRPPLPIFDEDGLIDPDAAMRAAFDGVMSLVRTYGARGIDRVDLANIEVVLPGREDLGVLRIVEARLASVPGTGLSLSAQIEALGRTASIEGTAELDRQGHVETLALRFDAPLPEGGEPETVISLPGGHVPGAVNLALSGAQSPDGARFTVAGTVKGATLVITRDPVPADITLRATATSGGGKVEIENLEVVSGRTRFAFNGAIGPAPSSVRAEAEPFYRFELVSDGSTVAPSDSPEPPLPIVARVAGRLGPDARVLTVDEIGVRTPQSEVRGKAVVRFEPGLNPGFDLTIHTQDIPVAQAKQLWPWFSARGAREWTLANVYGGQVEEGELHLAIPPGKIGNGEPLEDHEVSGRFAVSGTRFDIAGTMPPVRDSTGVVAFRGTDVDVTLDAGTAFLPGGRSVRADQGTLTIRNAHIKPIIGKLQIDVAGEADTLLELASHRPIDVGRFIDFKPSDLTGKVKGTVVADIPLQRNIDVKDLDWRVALDYENVDLATPFEGYTVAAANGSIVVDPSRAVIEAKARLNDAPATVHLVEPLGRDKSARRRQISVEMDDKARRAIAPGLDTLLTGAVSVDFGQGSDNRREVKANLNRSTLQIPWAGWSKGSGVRADVAFAMETNGRRIELSDFTLSGDTFGARGTLSLVDGAVTNVRFPAARLNRGDDFSFDMQARNGGYAITVRGKSIDARSVIKLYARDPAGGAAAPDTAAPLTIDLQVASVTGFHGEVLQDVNLQYAGTGQRTDLIELSARTRGGGEVTFSDRRHGTARAVSMRSADAGALLRFLDVYQHVEGGNIAMSLGGNAGGRLVGQIEATNFWIVNEPRLNSIVSTAPSGDGRSLNQAVRRDIDTTRTQFERGFAQIEKGNGYLKLQNGVVRGPLIGSTFQGTFYDANGNMDVTGTFMPAYGLNRIFGELPLIGQILGNGRDRGLIGITFRLAGKAGEPQLQVNPLSVIAPGIFRSVFEYR